MKSYYNIFSFYIKTTRILKCNFQPDFSNTSYPLSITFQVLCLLYITCNLHSQGPSHMAFLFFLQHTKLIPASMSLHQSALRINAKSFPGCPLLLILGSAVILSLPSSLSQPLCKLTSSGSHFLSHPPSLYCHCMYHCLKFSH